MIDNYYCTGLQYILKIHQFNIGLTDILILLIYNECNVNSKREYDKKSSLKKSA